MERDDESHPGGGRGGLFMGGRGFGFPGSGPGGGRGRLSVGGRGFGFPGSGHGVAVRGREREKIYLVRIFLVKAVSVL